jgi:hypothetical protein
MATFAAKQLNSNKKQFCSNFIGLIPDPNGGQFLGANETK